MGVSSLVVYNIIVSFMRLVSSTYIIVIEEEKIKEENYKL